MYYIKKKIKYYKNLKGVEFDKRSKMQIYRDLKKKDDKITLVVTPREYLIEKKNKIIVLSGISNSKTIHCNESGYYSIYESDRYGFNNPDIEWDKINIEYLLVGDSFTHGACVNRPNDMASVLRNLSGKSTLNLGFGGNGPLLQYATLREYLINNVKNILWFYYEENDLSELNSELESDILTRYLEDTNFKQNLILKQNEIDISHKSIIDGKEKEGRFLKFVKIYKTRNSLSLKQQKQINKYTEFNKILEKANNLALDNGSKFYFIYLPEFNRYRPNYDNKSYEKVKKIVKKLNIPFIDMHKEVFEKERDPLKLFPLGLYGHYNELGYKKVSNTIYKFISKW